LPEGSAIIVYQNWPLYGVRIQRSGPSIVATLQSMAGVPHWTLRWKTAALDLALTISEFTGLPVRTKLR
jgi:hypothetical protein